MEKIFVITPDEVQLTADEKSAIRGHVLSFVLATPVVEPAVRQKPFVGRISARVRVFFAALRRPLPAIGLASALLLATGGVAVAAENSLPGDHLYVVKHLTEEFRAHLQATEEGRARWEAERAQRRLEEAEALERQGRATPEVTAQLRLEYQTMVNQIHARVERLRAEQNTTAADQVQTSLDTLQAR